MTAELWAWIDYPGRTHYVRLRLADDGYHPAGTRCGTRPAGDPAWPCACDTPVCRRCWRLVMATHLTIDRKYLDPWTGTLPTRFVLISNELPRFGDASGAIAGRFVVLELSRSWIGRENTALTDELLTELPGILNWALDGLARLRVRGRMVEPESSRDAIVALQDLVSPVAAFVRERCEPHGEVPVDKLYAAWKSWAEDNGHRPGSSSTFGRDLRAARSGIKVIRPREGDSDRRRHYVGVSLATADNGRSTGPAWTAPPEKAANGADHPLVQDGPLDHALSAHAEDEDPDAWYQQALATLNPGHPDHGLQVAALRAEHVQRRRNTRDW